MLFEFGLELGFGLVTCKNTFKIHWLYRNDWKLLIFMNKFKWGSSLVLVFIFLGLWWRVEGGHGGVRVWTSQSMQYQYFLSVTSILIRLNADDDGLLDGKAMNNLCFGKYIHKCLVGWWIRCWTEFNDPETNRNETSVYL